MSAWDWLREALGVDDLVDAGELVQIFNEWRDAATTDAATTDAATTDAATTGAATTIDYQTLRDAMEWTEFGDTGQSTREYLLEKSSLEGVTKDKDGQIIRGFWQDQHTGFKSANPQDFDIDHRVPFSNIVETFPEIYDLPKEAQLEIYNDPDNLQVSHDQHNAAKGAEMPADHAATIGDATTRDDFLTLSKNYIEKLTGRFTS